MDKKSVKLAILDLAIVTVGGAAVCTMGFPIGLLIILPGAVPPILQLVRQRKQKR